MEYLQDTVVTNDRWGSGTQCKHGDFYTCADRSALYLGLYKI